MFERPTLSNGYLWVCNAAMSSSQARRIEQGLGEIRCEIRVRDLNEGVRDGNGQVVPAYADTIVQVWAHPDDDQAAQSIVTQALAEP